MQDHFQKFINDNSDKITQIANLLQDFEINAKKIGIRNAKNRVIQWLMNFNEVGFTNFELPLYLLSKIDFLKFDVIADRIIKDADSLISQNSSYITYLGEPNESSYRFTSKLNTYKNFYISLSELLIKLPNSKSNKILFFDDFLNSGGQLVSIFYALLNKPHPDNEINDEADNRIRLNSEQITKLRKAEIHLFFYQAFNEGWEKIEMRLINDLNLNIKIHCHHSTNNNDSIFGDKDEQEKIEEGAYGNLQHRSIFQGQEYSSIKDFYLILKKVGELLLRSKEPNWVECKFQDRALGYGNLGRIIITYSNVPTITLTALWQSGTIELNGKIIEWKELVPRTKKVLAKRTPSLEMNVEEINYTSKAEELQLLYINDEFRDGLKLAESYFIKYGSHPKILKHVLRFNLRDKNWPRIKEIINGLDDSELIDEQRKLCMFALFESGLREAYEFRSHSSKFKNAIQNLRQHLNHVPISQRDNSQYFYLLGRWHLERWWIYRTDSNPSNLAQALSSFTHAQNINDTWWTQCFKCIVLKLLNRQEFKTEVKMFQQRILKIQENNQRQPSVKLYCIAAIILADEKIQLDNYLRIFNQEISPTDFEDSLIHKIEIIYYNNNLKQIEYKKIIVDWLQSLPRK